MKTQFQVQKWSFAAVLLAALALSACAADPSGSTAAGPSVTVTGDAAVDLSAKYLPVEELQALGLVSGTSKNVASFSDITIYVYGPLHDRRLVRGKKLGVSFVKQSASNPYETYTVNYGFYGATNRSAEMTVGSNGNYYVFIDVPQDAQNFRFVIAAGSGARYSDYGFPYALRVYDAIASVGYAYGVLTVNYSGDAIGYHEKLHYGFNDWQNVKDAPMSSTSSPVVKYVQPGGYATVNLFIPDSANYIDFAVNGNDLWDNNGGADWHFSLRPVVSAQVVSIESAQKQVSIYYSNGMLFPPTAHWGYDGWHGVTDSPMFSGDYVQWNAFVTVPASAGSLQTVFRDGDCWQNNYGMNWNFDL